METEFHKLAKALEAVGTDRFFERFTDYLRACLEYDNVIVIVFRGSAEPHVAYKKIYGPDVFRFLEQQYLPAAYVLDPIYHMHINRAAPGLYRLLETAPDNFRRSRYYKWYYGRIGITDEISVVLPVKESTTITVSMGRDQSSGKLFGLRSDERLRAHEPIIMSLLEAHWDAATSSVDISETPGSVVQDLRSAMSKQRGVALTARQAEVALLILRGHSSPSIGLHLGISSQTVKVFRKQLYSKCGISSQAELFGLMMPILERHNSSKPI